MSQSPLSASAYEILGVSSDVDEVTLRRAYRVKMRHTHPDHGGDAALFIQVQQAWLLVGTPQARAQYDRRGGSNATRVWEGSASASRSPRSSGTRPKARSYGHPGGRQREQYLSLMREWVGRGVEIENPYDATLVARAPREIRGLLAQALAEENTARTVSALGMGFTVWHGVGTSHPGAVLPHIVLAPSGVYAIASLDPGGVVRVRRGELLMPEPGGEPIAELMWQARSVSRQSRVKFTAAIVVVPDACCEVSAAVVAKVRGIPVALVTQSALASQLRVGVAGARMIGGNELFDTRTRLQQSLTLV